MLPARFKLTFRRVFHLLRLTRAFPWKRHPFNVKTPTGALPRRTFMELFTTVGFSPLLPLSQPRKETPESVPASPPPPTRPWNVSWPTAFLLRHWRHYGSTGKTPPHNITPVFRSNMTAYAQQFHEVEPWWPSHSYLFTVTSPSLQLLTTWTIRIAVKLAWFVNELIELARNMKELHLIFEWFNFCGSLI